MIFNVRFMAGVVVGAMIGLVIAPEDAQRVGLDIRAIKSAIPGFRYSTPEESELEAWPSDETARRELFRFSKWDFDGFGPASTVRVTRCLRLDQISMACELRASLSWITEEKTIEAVFSTEADSWTMTNARAR